MLVKRSLCAVSISTVDPVSMLPTTCRAYRNSTTHLEVSTVLTLTVLVATIDAQWEGMGDVGSARYEPALLPPCPTIRVVSYSN